jgi:hypothetical protein
MIWILLLYVLPFLICCVIVYYQSKRDGETVGQYLEGVLYASIPIFNILYILFVIIEYIKADKSIQEFFNRKL